MFNMTHHIAHDRDFGYSASGGYDRCRKRLGAAAEHGHAHEFPGTEFDELVVGQWAHIEQMDTGFWWMSIGNVTLHVNADRDGRPTRVTVHMPGTWDDALPGCEYVLNEKPWWPTTEEET
jgi:hypothetical protein